MTEPKDKISELEYEIQENENKLREMRAIIKDLQSIIALLSTKIDLSNEEFLRYRIKTYLNPNELTKGI